MKKRRLVRYMLILMVLLIGAPAVESCGSLHSYWGVENDYYYSDGHGHDRHHHPKKHKKHKKHKKPKHHRHHHDDDD